MDFRIRKKVREKLGIYSMETEMLRELTEKYTSQCVKRLARKYNFKVVEALKF